MSTNKLGSCCVQYVNSAEPYCPVCYRQLEEYRAERDRAVHYRVSPRELRPSARQLVDRGALDPAEVGLGARIVRGALCRYPARRAVFKLLGIYLPEKQAQQILRNIHDYKWLSAEKAGEDIWRKHAPESPFAAAAREWASRYLSEFLQWAHQRRAA